MRPAAAPFPLWQGKCEACGNRAPFVDGQVAHAARHPWRADSCMGARAPVREFGRGRPLFATTSAYAGRVANTAIGTLAGLVVFGPVGAVAGAAVGYTAGHGIARSWGLSRPQYRSSRIVQRKPECRVSSVPMPKSKPVDSRPVERRGF